jgi:hypothetical protein
VVVEDIEFSDNVISHTASGFNLLGHDDTDVSGQLARITLRNNLLFDVSSSWTGSGMFAQIGGEPRDITIDHNTVMQTGNIITFYSGQYPNGSGVRVNGGPVLGFVFTNNMIKHNTYGITGSGQGYGNQALAYYAPGAVVARNVIAGSSSLAARYPPDNQFPSVGSFDAAFMNPGGLDYALVPGNPYVNAGLDGRNIGCDAANLPINGTRPVNPGGLRVLGR